MPYIPQEKRPEIDRVLDDLHHVLVGLEADDDSNNMEGNMNYLITRLLRKVYGTSYSEINAAVGMLECCKLEHYRTIAVPYEIQKLHDNGDVEINDIGIRLPEVTVEKTDKD